MNWKSCTYFLDTYNKHCFDGLHWYNLCFSVHLDYGGSRIKIIGRKDKRQLTVVFGCSMMEGDLLPPQLIYRIKQIDAYLNFNFHPILNMAYVVIFRGRGSCQKLGGSRIESLSIDSMQSTLSMCSMLLLGGLGACPPGNVWKLDALRLHLRAFWAIYSCINI